MMVIDITIMLIINNNEDNRYDDKCKKENDRKIITNKINVLYQ